LSAHARQWHTDVLTARNALDQAEVNLRLQRLTPLPDLQTGVVVQHDNQDGLNQFNLQLGVALPTFDRNQGNIRQAAATVGRARENIRAVGNDAASKLAEAFGRYESARVAVCDDAEKVIPHLAQSYLGLMRRRRNEPDKASFLDQLGAQQSLVQALQSYLQALAAQWQAVADIAAAAQLDDLYQCENPTPAVP
jgi:cobalt-zinc-cadmium efflux system outer membrane protein